VKPATSISTASSPASKVKLTVGPEDFFVASETAPATSKLEIPGAGVHSGEVSAGRARDGAIGDASPAFQIIVLVSRNLHYFFSSLPSSRCQWVRSAFSTVGPSLIFFFNARLWATYIDCLTFCLALGYMQGSGGGPSEGNVSGYLIRSTATKWEKDSVLAIDAGTHLAGLIRIFEEHASSPLVEQMTSPSMSHTPNSMGETEATTDGHDTPRTFPFSGAQLPRGNSPGANAVYVTRELVSTYLITHTHLDHIAGFVINTAAFVDIKRPKKLAAMPQAINAVKTHIFNDVIWPNLSDEEAGVGLVSYQRLPVAGEYVSVTEGLTAQAWPVSHGHCMKRHTHWGRKSTSSTDSDGLAPQSQERWCVLDSSVYFIRDEATGKEVMFWGDVEPDSVSLDPRNRAAWIEAAKKIYQGTLSTIFIECSYDVTQSDSALFGHLSPPHLMIELQSLALEVKLLHSIDERDRGERLKRKRQSNGYLPEDRRNRHHHPAFARLVDTEGVHTPPPENIPSSLTLPPSAASALGSQQNAADAMRTIGGVDLTKEVSSVASLVEGHNLLKGLTVVVTHVKDTFRNGEDVPTKVLKDLETLERQKQLGVKFVMARQGGSIFF